MGNYSNELRWKFIRANNLLQFIHQVTIEFMFWKSVALERFKSVGLNKKRLNYEKTSIFRWQMNLSVEKHDRQRHIAEPNLGFD